MTGGKQPGDRFTEAEASARYLVERGVPADAIVFENAGRSTYESLEAVADLLARPRPATVLLVTDPFHALRSRLIAEELGLEAYVSPTGHERRDRWRRRSPSHLKEAAGVAVGRIIGFDRLQWADRLTRIHSVTASRPAVRELGRTLHGEWCNWQHSRFWFCYSGFDSFLPSSTRQFAVARRVGPVVPVRLIGGTAIVTHRNSARSSSGLGHHPLKVAARVRIPYGLPKGPGQTSRRRGLDANDPDRLNLTRFCSRHEYVARP